MDNVHLHVLVVEARSAASELHDITKATLVSPGHLHALADVMLALVDTCQQLYARNLALVVQACRQQRPGERQ
jgi:hypothetical protein